MNVFWANEKRFNFLIQELVGLRAAQSLRKKRIVIEYTNGLLERYFERFTRDLTVDPNRKSRIRKGREKREKV